MHAQSFQSCPTLCDPMDRNSIHQTRQGHLSLAVRFRAVRLTSQDRSCPFRVMIPHSPESRGWHPDGLLGCSSFQRCGISFACLSRDRSHKAPQVPGTMGGSFTLPPSPQSSHSTPGPRRRPDPLELPYEGQGGLDSSPLIEFTYGY